MGVLLKKVCRCFLFKIIKIKIIKFSSKVDLHEKILRPQLLFVKDLEFSSNRYQYVGV